MRIFVKCVMGFLIIPILMAGCATVPRIEASNFTKPKTVVIDDFPDLKALATIRIAPFIWPSSYFSPLASDFFEMVKPLPVASIPINSLISREAELERMAQFPVLFRKALHGKNLRQDLLAEIRSRVEAKGVKVIVNDETRDMLPLLRWPMIDVDGLEGWTGPLNKSASVDADFLVQLSPYAIYAAPGPASYFARKAGIAVAIYEGRTRKFVGWQAFPYRAQDSKFEYLTYSSLVENLDQAAPALHSALLSLAPAVANSIIGENTQP